jgi:hypothetical protein
MSRMDEMRAKYLAEQKVREIADAEALKAFAPTVPVPDGWATAIGDDSYWIASGKVERPNYTLTSPDGGIEIIFRTGGCGTTKFRVGDKWYTFDRHGVDSSFYWLDWGLSEAKKKKKTLDIGKIIAEQIARVQDRLLFHAGALDVPEIGHKIAPERKGVLTAALKSEGHITFTPSGFGTGYTVAIFSHVTKNGSKIAGFSRWRRATAALDDFFNVGPLWIETFDCD